MGWLHNPLAGQYPTCWLRATATRGTPIQSGSGPIGVAANWRKNGDDYYWRCQRPPPLLRDVGSW